MRGQLHQHAHEITGKVLAVPVLSPESHFLKREIFCYREMFKIAKEKGCEDSQIEIYIK